MGGLLTADDPSPVEIVNPRGGSPFLLIGDHAGKLLPSALGSLGVGPDNMARHIAWDIGVAGLGERLAEALDATFIRQTYSRLVIDCNRDPAAHDAMPETSDSTPIPANRNLSPADREARVAAIHTPYQTAIATELARRDALGAETILVALHSFTPRMREVDRSWHVGVLHFQGDSRLALAMLRLLRNSGDYIVGDNEPYAMDGIDYTVPRHAFAAGRRYVEIELRQDLLASAEQQAGWATTLAPLLLQAATETA